MRIFNLEIEGKEYKACCGLRVLGELQKRYGSLKEFEKKIAPYSQKEENDSQDDKTKVDDDIDVDIDVILDTAKLFLNEGAEATGGESIADKVPFMSCNPFALSIQLFNIYLESMIPENEEPEKN